MNCVKLLTLSRLKKYNVNVTEARIRKITLKHFQIIQPSRANSSSDLDAFFSSDS